VGVGGGDFFVEEVAGGFMIYWAGGGVSDAGTGARMNTREDCGGLTDTGGGEEWIHTDETRHPHRGWAGGGGSAVLIPMLLETGWIRVNSIGLCRDCHIQFREIDHHQYVHHQPTDKHQSWVEEPT
jgi:hypothetical protein